MRRTYTNCLLSLAMVLFSSMLQAAPDVALAQVQQPQVQVFRASTDLFIHRGEGGHAELAAKVQLLLVVGAKNSSNSNRLRELAEKMGCTAYLIDTAADIQQSWLADVTAVGVTAGASAPEVLVQQVVQQLTAWGGKQVIEHPGREENVVFAVPAELR